MQVKFARPSGALGSVKNFPPSWPWDRLMDRGQKIPHPNPSPDKTGPERG